MEAAEFADYHEAALAIDEVRHGAVLALLMQARQGTLAGFMHWTLGGSGQCAVTATHRSLFLGVLDKNQCRMLAELTARVDYRGVIGADSTANWLVDRAVELGLVFRDPVPQQIHSISDTPRYPGSPGHAGPVTAQDSALFVDWMMAFQREAVPHNRSQTHEELERIAAEGRFTFWIDKEQPVSMAGIVRRLRNSAAITGVYTPPELRGRGYAGSVTAAVVERIYAEGRKTACLYTDLRNSFSNRCYAKIGFKPVCTSMQFYRCDLASSGTKPDEAVPDHRARTASANCSGVMQ